MILVIVVQCRGRAARPDLVPLAWLLILMQLIAWALAISYHHNHSWSRPGGGF
jgi:hypothetical protein